MVVKQLANGYNRYMVINKLYEWQLTVTEAREVQKQLAVKIRRTGKVSALRLIAGVDVSARKIGGMGTGSAVVLEYPGLSIIEARVVQGKLGFPYIL